MTMSIEAPSVSPQSPKSPNFNPDTYTQIAEIGDQLDMHGLARLAYYGRGDGPNDPFGKRRKELNAEEPFAEHNSALDAMDPLERGTALAEYLTWREVITPEPSVLPDSYEAISAMAVYFPQKERYLAAAAVNADYYHETYRAKREEPYYGDRQWTEAQLEEMRENAPTIPERPQIPEKHHAIFMAILRSSLE